MTKLSIALSAYATYKPFTFDEWVAARKEMKDHKLMRSLKTEQLQRRV